MNTAKLLKKADGVSTLERPRYSPGLLLEDTDLTAGVEYTRELTRLLFRSLFGCGVICGLDVTATLKCKRTALEVEVAPGLGLDGAGNPLHVLKTQTLTYDPDCEPMPESVWVVLCYKDKDCRPKDVSCAGEGDSRSENTRSRDGFVVKLYDGLPECACTCAKPQVGRPARRLGRCCHDDEEEAAEIQRQKREAAVRRAYAELEPGLTARLEEDRARMGVETIIRPGVAPMAGMGATTGTAPAPGSATGQPKLPDICKCYDDHNAGKCIPDCGCICVVLARVDTKPPDDGKDEDVPADVDPQVRRWIRPILTGYLECLEPKKPAPPPATPLTVKCEVNRDTIPAGERTVAKATVGGANGARLSYSWATDAAGSIITGITETATFQSASLGNPAQAVIKVVVTDDRGRRAESTCAIKIIEIN